MSTITALARAIEICGSQAALASKIGVSQQAISSWLNKSARISAEHVLPIERATEGAVSRHELRPDIYPTVEVDAAQ